MVYTLEAFIAREKRLELADRIERDLKSGAHMFSLHGAEMDAVIHSLRDRYYYLPDDVEVSR
jgi:hypothetical protein